MLVCRHPKTNCSCQWLNSASPMNKILMDTWLSVLSGYPSWVIQATSKTSLPHTQTNIRNSAWVLMQQSYRPKQQMYSQTAVYINAAATPTRHNNLPPVCSRHKVDSWERHMGTNVKWAEQCYRSASKMSCSNLHVVCVYLTGCEEEQWPLRRKRLQRQL